MSVRDNIYESEIFRDFLGDAQSSESPAVVFLAGQAGAAKSFLAQHEMDNFDEDEEDYVKIDPDELRPYNPDYEELIEKNSHAAAGKAYVSDWEQKLYEDALLKRVNIIVDGTGSNEEIMRSRIEQARQAGYDVSYEIVATNIIDSKENVIVRYENGKAHDLLNPNERLETRDVPEKAQEKQCAALPKTAEVIEKEGLADYVAVFTGRNPVPVYENKEAALGGTTKASEVLVAERARLKTPAEEQHRVEQAEKAKILMEARNATPEEMARLNTVVQEAKLKDFSSEPGVLAEVHAQSTAPDLYSVFHAKEKQQSDANQPALEEKAGLVTKQEKQTETSIQQQSPQNKEMAENYAVREGAQTANMTDRAKFISENEPKIQADLSYALKKPSDAALYADKLKENTEKEFVSQTKGDVRVFSAEASRQDGLRTEIIPALVHNKDVKSINGIERGELQKILDKEENGLNRVNAAIDQADLRLDMQQAMRTASPSLIKGAVTREELYKEKQATEQEGKTDQMSVDASSLNSRIEERTEQLTASSQQSIKEEAVNKVQAYVDHRAELSTYDPKTQSMVKGQLMSPEQAQKTVQWAEKIAENPEKASRLGALAEIKLTRDQALAENDKAKVSKYLDKREQFLKDSRAVRAANNEQVVPRNAQADKMQRADAYRRTNDYAKLRNDFTGGRVKDYQKSKDQLDRNHDMMRQQDEQKRKEETKRQTVTVKKIVIVPKPALASSAKM